MQLFFYLFFILSLVAWGMSSVKHLAISPDFFPDNVSIPFISEKQAPLDHF